MLCETTEECRTAHEHCAALEAQILSLQEENRAIVRRAEAVTYAYEGKDALIPHGELDAPFVRRARNYRAEQLKHHQMCPRCGEFRLCAAGCDD